ncbi:MULTISPECIES: hypothetical protein [Streptosporangium]|uniref:ESX-1 secretion-associated protein n=1 Tax=Streptosporangium brasiliense TaxID=47480 RepID=A0ABT9RKS8_9ACTN|nr:hypothetical protein [Streptosporangium brasiliense]MDP9868930.1 hypothetical protein [Streptosporangium brasiliense]
MAREFWADDTSMANAAYAMDESAELFGRHVDALLGSLAGGGRSPWGIGVLGMAVDELNLLVGEACTRLHESMVSAGAGLRDMAAVRRAAERASVIDPS